MFDKETGERYKDTPNKPEFWRCECLQLNININVKCVKCGLFRYFI